MFAKEAGLGYRLVAVEDGIGFVWFQPMRSCSAATMGWPLIRWRALLGPPKVWVSDTATRFKNGLMTILGEVL